MTRSQPCQPGTCIHFEFPLPFRHLVRDELCSRGPWSEWLPWLETRRGNSGHTGLNGRRSGTGALPREPMSLGLRALADFQDEQGAGYHACQKKHLRSRYRVYEEPNSKYQTGFDVRGKTKSVCQKEGNPGSQICRFSGTQELCYPGVHGSTSCGQIALPPPSLDG